MPEVKVISKLDVPDTLILLPLPTLLNKNFGRVVFFSKIIFCRINSNSTQEVEYVIKLVTYLPKLLVTF